jgi:hypothetical protein
MTRRVIVLLWCATAVLSVTSIEGCAAFSSHLLPTIPLEQLTPPTNKPAIEYDLTATSNGKPAAGNLSQQQKHIEAVFDQSQMFSSVKAGIGTTPYHFSITTNEEFNEGATFLSGFISGFTFLVVPGYAHADIVITIDVKQGDRFLKQYQYRDGYSMWTEILLIFIMPVYWPPTVINETFDNMMRNFLYDLERDNILQNPAPVPGAL